jgi:hypothetical protein
MSDISTFVRRGSGTNDAINRLQVLITPIAFPDPESDSLQERIILSTRGRKRSHTVATGTDITTTSSNTKDRFSSSITILPDTATPSAYPTSDTLSGTLDLSDSVGKKFGAGAKFDGTQYISLPDNAQFDLELPLFTMAFWYKNDGISEGPQTIWDKGEFGVGRDFCSACTDFHVDDFSIIEDTAIDAGMQIQLQGDLTEDFCSACTDFDASFRTSHK